MRYPKSAQSDESGPRSRPGEQDGIVDHDREPTAELRPQLARGPQTAAAARYPSTDQARGDTHRTGARGRRWPTGHQQRANQNGTAIDTGAVAARGRTARTQIMRTSAAISTRWPSRVVTALIEAADASDHGGDQRARLASRIRCSPTTASRCRQRSGRGTLFAVAE